MTYSIELKKIFMQLLQIICGCVFKSICLYSLQPFLKNVNKKDQNVLSRDKF